MEREISFCSKQSDQKQKNNETKNHSKIRTYADILIKTQRINRMTWAMDFDFNSNICYTNSSLTGQPFPTSASTIWQYVRAKKPMTTAKYWVTLFCTAKWMCDTYTKWKSNLQQPNGFTNYHRIYDLHWTKSLLIVRITPFTCHIDLDSFHKVVHRTKSRSDKTV